MLVLDAPRAGCTGACTAEKEMEMETKVEARKWPVDMDDLKEMSLQRGYRWFVDGGFFGSRLVGGLVAGRVFVESQTNPFGGLGAYVRGEGPAAEERAIRNSRTHVVHLVEKSAQWGWSVGSLYRPGDGWVSKKLAEILAAQLSAHVRAGLIPDELERGMEPALLKAVSPKLWQQLGSQDPLGWVFDGTAGFAQEVE